MSYVRRRTQTGADGADGGTADGAANNVIDVARFIYRCCKVTRGLVTLDEKTMWRVMYEAFEDDTKGKRLLAELENTPAWSHAVTTAKSMYELYATGEIEDRSRF